MRKIIFATKNEDKMKEIRMILDDPEFEIISMREAGIDLDIVEDGTTFEENALIKARAVAEASGEIVLADDSGLEIDCLNKEPGVYSARFAGEDTPYSVKNQLILQRLEGVPKERRTARFVCVIAAALPDGRALISKGVMEGYIGFCPAGENGFGFDPIFYLWENDCSTAQIDPARKNELSHRGQALRGMKGQLESHCRE